MSARKCEARTGAAGSKSKQAALYRLLPPLLAGSLPGKQPALSQTLLAAAQCRHLGYGVFFFHKALGKRSRQAVKAVNFTGKSSANPTGFWYLHP